MTAPKPFVNSFGRNGPKMLFFLNLSMTLKAPLSIICSRCWQLHNYFSILHAFFWLQCPLFEFRVILSFGNVQSFAVWAETHLCWKCHWIRQISFGVILLTNKRNQKHNFVDRDTQHNLKCLTVNMPLYENNEIFIFIEGKQVTSMMFCSTTCQQRANLHKSLSLKLKQLNDIQPFFILWDKYTKNMSFTVNVLCTHNTKKAGCEVLVLWHTIRH